MLLPTFFFSWAPDITIAASDYNLALLNGIMNITIAASDYNLALLNGIITIAASDMKKCLQLITHHCMSRLIKIKNCRHP